MRLAAKVGMSDARLIVTTLSSILSEPRCAMADNGIAVTETSCLEIEASDLNEASLGLAHVFVAGVQTRAAHIGSDAPCGKYTPAETSGISVGRRSFLVREWP